MIIYTITTQIKLVQTKLHSNHPDLWVDRPVVMSSSNNRGVHQPCHLNRPVVAFQMIK